MLEVKGANQAQRPRHMYTRYNSTHITAITRSLKILNSEGAVDKAKWAIFHFLEIHIELEVF